MSNLGLLININIINEFGLNKIKYLNKKEKTKIIGMILASSILIIYVIYKMFNFCLDISDTLIQYNLMDLLLISGFTGAVLFSLITTIYKGSSYLFEAKDFESLISLPINEVAILLSKIFMLLISNYLFTVPFLLIPGIVYFIRMDISSIYLVNLILMFLCVPLIPIIISSMIAFLLGNISSKLKHKSLILIIGSIILLAQYVLLVSKMDVLLKNIIENSNSVTDTIKKIYFMSYYFIEGLKNNDILLVLKFIFISILSFILFIVLFSKQYKIINSRMNENYKAKKYEIKDLKNSSIISALLQKEVKRYFSSYIYVLNSSIGIILLSIFSIGIIVFGQDKMADILQLNLDFAFIKIQIISLILFCIMTTCTTYCSISLEGKTLWILKSSPIK
ncbi:ABC transporter permease [Romboutsia sp. 1001713B170207_170306_H8]|uniref:ABC transporter permease n=1 Tax=Romboutsia sp. 1001713B170207_170306_H8 TaxID=2787112 RepID=UPI001899EBF0|nr:ABC transporter permease [Romboutsia sp. 1001713B170207_170306_H8]